MHIREPAPSTARELIELIQIMSVPEPILYGFMLLPGIPKVLLDLAIAKACTEDSFTDEINPPPNDSKRR